MMNACEIESYIFAKMLQFGVEEMLENLIEPATWAVKMLENLLKVGWNPHKIYNYLPKFFYFSS